MTVNGYDKGVEEIIDETCDVEKDKLIEFTITIHVNTQQKLFLKVYNSEQPFLHI